MTSPQASAQVAHLAPLFTVSFLAQVIQIGTVPAALALKLHAAGASPAAIGWVAGGPWAAILFTGHRVPRLLERLGVARCLAGALLASIVALLGMIETADPFQLFCLDLLLGAALIVRWVACDTWLVASTPAALRGRIIGAHETLMGCGIAAGPLLLSIPGAPRASLATCIALAAASEIVLLAIACPKIPALDRSGLRPGVPGTMPVAVLAGGLAGLVESAALSFLPLMASRALFVLSAPAALLGFGLGGTVLQAPLGGLAERLGHRRAQLATALVVLGGALGIGICARWPLGLAAVLLLR